MTMTLPRLSKKRRLLRLVTCAVIAGLLSAYLAIFYLSGTTLSDIARNWYFLFVGVSGATIANATGVGGGVVFLPAFAFFEKFQAVALTPGEIVAISFLMQCFGMTTGAITWANKLFGAGAQRTGVAIAEFRRMLLFVTAPCVITLLITQNAAAIDQSLIFFLFKGFSLAFGAALLSANLISGKTPPSRASVSSADYTALFLIGAAGGVVTALFSVGVGEMAALYLFLRRYPITTCVPIAVICTAITVLCGAPHSILANDIPWVIIICAAPGLVLGGFISRRLAYWLGAYWLKVFAAIWILASSLGLILLRI